MRKPAIPSPAGLGPAERVLRPMKEILDNLDEFAGTGSVGATGATGTTGATGATGPAGPANLVIGTSAPTPGVGEQVLWVDTTGGDITLNLVTG